MGNTPSAIPNGYQLNQISLNLTCLSNNNVSVINPFTISMLTPLAAADFYITDINGYLVTGDGFSTGELDLGIRAGDTSTIYPAVEYEAYGYPAAIGLNSQPYEGGIGRFYAGNNTYSKISIVSAGYTLIQGEDNNGKPIKTSYICDVPENVVATVLNDGTSAALDFQNPVRNVVLPVPPVGMKVTEANIPYACESRYLDETYTQFNVSVRATIPLTVSDPFSIDGAVIFITPSAEVVRYFQAGSQDPGIGIGYLISAQEVNGAQYGFGFNLINASPSPFDVATHFVLNSQAAQVTQTGAIINFYKVVNDAVTIPFPIVGNLSIGTFQPTDNGTFGMVPLGINGLLASKDLRTVETLICTVKLPYELFSAVIALP